MSKQLRKPLFLRIVSFLLALTFFSVNGEARVLYEPDNEENQENFMNGYGWDEEAMNAYEWHDFDGITQHRYSEYESSFFKDLLQQNEDLAIEYGFITGHSGILGGSASSMVTLALQEWEEGVCEIPPRSDNVKYNEWYWGYPPPHGLPNYTYDTNGDGRTDYDDVYYYPWCCAFISWCADQCGLIDEENEANGTFKKTAGCGQMQKFFREVRDYEYWECRDSSVYGGSHEVIPGDIIIWPGHEHIGIVVGITGDGLDVVEGNIQSRVNRFIYTRWDVTGGGELDGGHVYRILYPGGEEAIRIGLRNRGLNEAVICGIITALDYVSGCRSDRKESSAQGEIKAFGIAQWQGNRLQKFLQYASSKNLDPDDLDLQLDYLLYEMEQDMPELYQSLFSLPDSQGSAYQTAYDLFVEYLRPGTMESVYAVRLGKKAADYYLIRKGQHEEKS